MRDQNQRTHGEFRRGLATIAYLKARREEGKDHLDMFQPFIEEAIRTSGSDEIKISDIQKSVNMFSGVQIPENIVKTLLQRSSRRGLLNRHGGRFVRTDKNIEDARLQERIVMFEQNHQSLSHGLRQYAGQRGTSWQSDTDALSALIRFLDENHVAIVLGQRRGSPVRPNRDRHDRTIAQFVSMIINERGERFSLLEDLVKGLIVQNALLLRDIPVKRRHFDGLRIYLDTGILLKALGHMGNAEMKVTVDAIRLIRRAGARIFAFEATVDEVESILQVYEQRLRTPHGIRTLRPTSVTFHFFDTRVSSADVSQYIALLRNSINRLGIQIRTFPARIHQYTENEELLSRMLMDDNQPEEEQEARIWHDVNAIAAIMTLRAGERPRRVERSGHIFLSDSSMIPTAQEWYRINFHNSVDPIVEFSSVANIAWYVSPSDADNLPMNQLIAVCQAVLQPSTELWERFVSGLTNLVESNELEDDESIEILASEYARVRLGEVGLDQDHEANSLREIIERVKFDRDEKHRAAMSEEHRRRIESEQVAILASAQTDSILEDMNRRIEHLARVISLVVYVTFALSVGIGGVLSVGVELANLPNGGIAWRSASLIFISLYLFCTFLEFFSGRFRVFQLYDLLKSRITKWMKKRFIPSFDEKE